MSDEKLLSTPDADLSAGMYYRKYKLIQARAGSTGGRKVNLVPTDELYELYEYYSDQKGKPLTPNMFVKAVRAEGSKLSNERSKILVEEFSIRYKGEKDAK